MINFLCVWEISTTQLVISLWSLIYDDFVKARSATATPIVMLADIWSLVFDVPMFFLARVDNQSNLRFNIVYS